jgi:mRNA interferase MazF
MTTCRPGDVVLVRFPFTDLSSNKRRPVLVISPLEFSSRYGDLVVVPLTSRPQEHGLCLDKWREAGLVKPTWFKALIATVAEPLVEKWLGRIHAADEGKAASVLGVLIDAMFRTEMPE